MKTTKESKRTPVKELYYGMLDVTPVNYDWSEGYTTEWEFYEACSRNSEDVLDEKALDYADAEFAFNFSGSEFDEGYEFSGPVMNYCYPLPGYHGDPREDCKKLVDLPVCIVEFTDGGEYALALTGGGMDLTWEICEAYMLLGYLPPVHFAGNLPQMCGRGENAMDRWIIAGCRRALQGQKDRVGSALRRLRENFRA